MAGRSVFVSHAHVDNELCDQYVAALIALGFDVWYDRSNLQSGRSLSRDISRELQARAVFVLLLTPAAVNSSWVSLETNAYLDLAAHDPARLLLPVRIAPVDVPLVLRGFTWIDGVGLPVQTTVTRIADAIVEPAPPGQHVGRATDVWTLKPRAQKGTRLLRQPLERRWLWTAVSALLVVATFAAVFANLRGHGPSTGSQQAGPSSTSTSVQQDGTPSARCTASPPPGAGGVGANFALFSIASVAPSEAWAMGADGVDGVIFHYCNGAWAQVNGPPVNGVLTSISMLSADEGWAVGGSRGANGQPIILHYLHGAWAMVDSPTALSQQSGEQSTALALTQPSMVLAGQGEPALLSVSMVSATEGWAMGLKSMLHYHAGTWSSVAYPSLPNGAPTSAPVMFSVAMHSATEGWAVGTPNGYTAGEGNNGVILHYLNGSWTLVSSPPAPNGLFSVAMVSPSEGWAVGGGIILHYGNGHWTQQASLPNAGVNSVAMVAPTEGWAVGSNTILHYATGQWTRAYSGSAYLLGVAMVSSTFGWAVGEQGVILQYDGHAWH